MHFTFVLFAIYGTHSDKRINHHTLQLAYSMSRIGPVGIGAHQVGIDLYFSPVRIEQDNAHQEMSGDCQLRSEDSWGKCLSDHRDRLNIVINFFNDEKMNVTHFGAHTLSATR